MGPSTLVLAQIITEWWNQVHNAASGPLYVDDRGHSCYAMVCLICYIWLVAYIHSLYSFVSFILFLHFLSFVCLASPTQWNCGLCVYSEVRCTVYKVQMLMWRKLHGTRRKVQVQELQFCVIAECFASGAKCIRKCHLIYIMQCTPKMKTKYQAWLSTTRRG